MLLRVLQVMCVVSVVSVSALERPDATGDVIARDVFPGVGEYFFFGVEANWTEALRACQASKAHTVIIDSAAEAAAIRQMMTSYEALSIHLGFHDQFTEGDYVTILGGTLASSCYGSDQWAEGAPSGGPEFNCGGFDDAGFKDTRCGDKSVFICELDKPVAEQLPGYSLIPDHGYYKYYPTLALWPEADSTCRQDGAHLVVLNSQDEVLALKRQFSLQPTIYIWVGVHRFYGGNDNYMTVQGGLLKDTNFTTWFDEYQPYGTFLSHPYVEYYAEDSNSGLYTLTDDSRVYFICEHELF